VAELKLKYLSHHKLQIDSNPNYRAEIKSHKTQLKLNDPWESSINLKKPWQKDKFQRFCVLMGMVNEH